MQNILYIGTLKEIRKIYFLNYREMSAGENCKNRIIL